jgi:23S rRNA (uridine2552-2'-O)-methyltransferase
VARGRLGDRRARHDLAFRRAREEGYAARAVFKLEELDRRFRLLKRSARVLDLGCWPGSWLQYAAQRVGDGGLVVGVDLSAIEIELPPFVQTFVGDVEELRANVLLERFGAFDLVLSDLAPHTTGDRSSDQWRSEELFERAAGLARTVLRPGGHFAGKVFQGGRFGELLAGLRRDFQQAKAFRPPSTRPGSMEQYLIARGRR